MSRVLHDALSSCDRAGRKRRRGDFTVGMRIHDIAGGRLGSGGGDEERLRVQKRRYFRGCAWASVCAVRVLVPLVRFDVRTHGTRVCVCVCWGSRVWCSAGVP